MAYDLTQFRKKLVGIHDWLKREYEHIRVGSASPALLDAVRIEAYGAHLSIKEVASVVAEGPRTLRIAPWDKSHVKEIDKALAASHLGLSSVVDEQGIRVYFPELTEERRREIVKTAKQTLEEARKHIRQERDAVIKDLTAHEKEGMGKDDVFRLKNEIQKSVDESNTTLEDIYAKKEKEILN